MKALTGNETTEQLSTQTYVELAVKWASYYVEKQKVEVTSLIPSSVCENYLPSQLLRADVW